MKVALITRRYPPLIGGAEKVLSYLAPALAAEGAEVAVLTAQPIGLDAPGQLTVWRRAVIFRVPSPTETLAGVLHSSSRFELP